MKFEIVEGRLHHCGQILRRIRVEHSIALEKTGTDAHLELRTIFEKSAFRKALFIDGTLSGLGGVAGTLASGEGYIWLVLAQNALAHPFALVREARRQLAHIMETHTELATTVLVGDKAAIRLACFLGFHTRKTESLNDRKAHAEILASDLSIRVPIGSASVIALGYHEKRAA